MQIDWPEGVRKIVEDVHNEKAGGKFFGHSQENADEDAAQEIVERVKLKATIPGNPLVSEPIKAENNLHWAAKQYFRLLRIDLRRFNHFRDHEEVP
jgi:hypothetical protein